MPPDIFKLGLILLGAFALFVIYRRVRRNFGAQPLQVSAMKLRMAVLGALGCLLVPVALRSAALLATTFIALLCGTLLGLWGAQRTHFVLVGARLHYVAHAYTGVAVSLLLLARLGYRASVFYGGVQTPAIASARALAPTTVAGSPLTFGLLIVLICYYVSYYGLVLKNSKRSELRVPDADRP